MTAIAFVALMLAMAFVPMIGAENSSAAYTESSPQDVTVHMRVGDTFTYSPSLNISSGTVNYTMASAGQDGVTFESNKLTAMFETSGTKTIMLKAHWESGTADGYNNVTQDAFLRLNMIIDERLNVIDATPTKILLVGSTNKAGSDIYTFAKGTAWTGPSGATGSNVTYKVYSTATDATKEINELSADSNKFTWDAADYKLKVGSSDLAEGTYFVRLNISYTNDYKQPDTAYAILAVLVSSDLKFVEENGDDFSLFRNLIADSANDNHSDSWAVRTNLDALIGAGDNDVKFTSRTITGVDGKAAPTDATTITGSPGTAAATPTFTIDASKIKTITENFATYQYNIAAQGTYGNATLDEAAIVTYHVYASAKFLNVPTVASSLFVNPSSDNPNDVTITTTVSNADTIMVYWGDGTSSKISAINADNVSYTARHVYATQANYLISVVAENNNGNTTGMVYYDSAKDLIDTNVENIKTQTKSIIDEHGYLFIILIVVGAIISIVSLIWFPDYRFVAVGLILIAIGVVIFFGGWKLP